MEEGDNNNVLFSWKNNHHIHNHRSSEISRDSNSNMNQSGNVVVSPASRLHIKIKGPSPSPSPSRAEVAADDDHNIIKNKNEEEDNNNALLHHSHGFGLRIKIKGPSPAMKEDDNNALHYSPSFSYLCNICNKPFISAYDLSVHTRLMHYLEDRKGSCCFAKTNKQKSKFMCHFCNKGFVSVYALNGHTRMHSHKLPKANNNVKTCKFGESIKREIQSPPSKRILSRCGIVTAAYGDTFSDTSVLRWPVFCKGNRKRFSSHPANSCSVDPLLEEAANTLLLLASGKNLEDDQEFKRMKMMSRHEALQNTTSIWIL